MRESLPVLKYSNFEETAFDMVPVLEGVVNGVVVFGCLSLQRADKGATADLVDPLEAYGKIGKTIRAVIESSSGSSIEGSTVVVGFEEAYQRVGSDRLAAYLKERRRILLERGPATAVLLAGKRPPIPKQTPKPVPVPPVPEPKPAPVVPDSPVTMTELLLQMGAMQTDFDLRLQVMAQRLSALEAK